MAITYLSGQRIQGLSYTPASSESHEVSTTNGSVATAGTKSSREQESGFRVNAGHPLIGKKPTSISMEMFRASSLTTGVIKLAWRRASDTDGSGTALEDSDTVNNSTLSVGDYGAGNYNWGTVTFDFDGTNAIEAGDYFLLNATVASGNDIKNKFKNANTEANIEMAEYGASGVSFNSGYEYVSTINYTISAVGDPKPTDVPTGSEFQEVDTRKFYQCGESTVSGSGLKAYYKLGTNYTSSPQTEANVASTVSGSSSSDLGSNANISIYNQPTQVTSGTPTNLGNANLFDGAQTTSGDYGKAGTDGNKSQWDFLHNTTSKFTFNVWLKFPDSKPENNRFLWSDAKASDSIPSFQVRSNGDPAYFRAIIANSTGNQSVLDTDGSPQLPIPTDDAWHMYTFTWDISLGSDNFTYRVDGATSGSNYKTDSKSGNSAVNTSADTSPLFMGDEYSTSYGRLNSSTCELAIWNRVLTDAEITTLYQDGAGLQLDTGIKVWTERGTAI